MPAPACVNRTPLTRRDLPIAVIKWRAARRRGTVAGIRELEGLPAGLSVLKR